GFTRVLSAVWERQDIVDASCDMPHGLGRRRRSGRAAPVDAMILESSQVLDGGDRGCRFHRRPSGTAMPANLVRDQSTAMRLILHLALLAVLAFVVPNARAATPDLLVESITHHSF